MNNSERDIMNFYDEIAQKFLFEPEKKTSISSFVVDRNRFIFCFFAALIPQKCYPSDFFPLSETEKKTIDLIANSISPEIKKEAKGADLSSVYQALLNQKIEQRNDSFIVNDNKSSRDDLGAYYTPLSFVDAIIGTGKKLPQNQSLADLSCGAGSFLVESAKEYLKNYGQTQENKHFIATHFCGVDVDPIALLLTAFNLSKITNEPSSLLVLGNPLLHNQRSTNRERMDRAFEGRFYSTDCGLPDSFFANRFDRIIGNPPWEKIRFEERKFFSSISPDISATPLKSERAAKILSLKSADPNLFALYQNTFSDYQRAKKLIKADPLFAKSSKGEANTYSLFTELSFHLLGEHGVSTLIVKSSLLKTSNNMPLVDFLGRNGHIQSIDSFVNRKKIFPIDSREEFAVLSVTQQKTKSIPLRFGLTTPGDLFVQQKDILTYEELLNLTGSIGILPNISDAKEISLLVGINSACPKFKSVFPDVKFGRLVHLTNHADHIVRNQKPSFLPVIEGKFFSSYDLRFSTFAGVPSEEAYKQKASSRKIPERNGKLKEWPVSRYFIDQAFWNRLSKNYSTDFILGWRSLSSPTNSVTMVSALLPFGPTCQSVQFLETNNHNDLLFLNGLFNSVIFDYLLKLRMPGLDLTQGVIKEMPVPSRQNLNSTFLGDTVFNDVVKAVKNIYQDEPALKRIIGTGFPVIEEPRLFIDKVLAKAYGFTDEQLRMILKKLSRV